MPFTSNLWNENCPPANATAASGVVFRVVKNRIPQGDDFLTHYERGRTVGGTECERKALSVWDDIISARKIAQRYPKMGTLIAEGILDDSFGVINSEGHHINWWVCDHVKVDERAALFFVVATV